jgi:hypothetical protein
MSFLSRWEKPQSIMQKYVWNLAIVFILGRGHELTQPAKSLSGKSPDTRLNQPVGEA